MKKSKKCTEIIIISETVLEFLKKRNLIQTENLRTNDSVDQSTVIGRELSNNQTLKISVIPK